MISFLEEFAVIFVDGKEYPDDAMAVTRYSINMKTWKLDEEKNLVKDQAVKNAFEFCNINKAYQGKPYKYAYMIKNFMKLNGTVIKLNVEDGSIIEDIMPNGMFPTGDENLYLYCIKSPSKICLLLI